MKYQGLTALVTGASAGLGEEFGGSWQSEARTLSWWPVPRTN
jgi:short-subunit dehydrogenase